MGSLGTDIGDGRDDGARQAALNREVPALDVATVNLAGIRAAHARRRIKGNDARTEVRPHHRRDTLGQRTDRHIVIQGRELEIHDDRILAAQRARPRQRAKVHAVTGTNDRLVVQAVSETHARRDVPLADREAIGARNVAAATQGDDVRGRIQPFQALAVRTAHQRVVLVTQAPAHGELAGDLETILRIDAKLILTRGGQNMLDALRHIVRQAQQERRVAVDVIERAIARHAAVEVERSARAGT